MSESLTGWLNLKACTGLDDSEPFDVRRDDVMSVNATRPTGGHVAVGTRPVASENSPHDSEFSTSVASNPN